MPRPASFLTKLETSSSKRRLIFINRADCIPVAVCLNILANRLHLSNDRSESLHTSVLRQGRAFDAACLAAMFVLENTRVYKMSRLLALLLLDRTIITKSAAP